MAETAIIDPAIPVGQLREVAEMLAKRGVRKVATMLPSHVHEFNECGFTVLSVPWEGWPYNDRHRTETLVLDALQALERERAACFSVPSLARRYDLRVVGFALGEIQALRVHLATVGAISLLSSVLNGCPLVIVTGRSSFACAARYAARELLGDPRVVTLQPPGAAAGRANHSWKRVVEGTATGVRALLWRSSKRPWVLTSAHRQLVPVIPELVSHDDIRVAVTLPNVLQAPASILHWNGGRRLAERVQAAIRFVREEMSPGSPLADIVARSFLEQLEHVLPQRAWRAQTYLCMLDAVKPSAILAINWQGDPSHPQRIWCKANGRPFIVVQHGFQIGSTISPSTQLVDADVFICWSEEYKLRWISTASRNESDVRALGNPVFPPSQLTRASVDPWPARPRVLVAPTSYSAQFNDAYIAFWEWVENYALSARGRFFVWTYRTHNHCGFRGEVREQARRCGARFSDRTQTFAQALDHADIVLATVGSAVLESCARGRPVVVLNQLAEREFFGEAGLAVVKSFDDAQCTLERVAEDGNFRNQLLDRQQAFFESFRADDSATSIAELVASLARQAAANSQASRRTRGGPQVHVSDSNQ